MPDDARRNRQAKGTGKGLNKDGALKPAPDQRRFIATASVKHTRLGHGFVQLVFEWPGPLDRLSQIMEAQDMAKKLVGVMKGYDRGEITDLFFMTWTEISRED